MTSLLLALGASLAWGVADFVGPLWARTWGTLRVLLWAQVGGTIAIGLAVAVRGEGPRGATILLATIAAVAGTAGLYAYYRGMAIGAMSVVAPIAGASAVIPVAWGVAGGDRPETVQVAGVVCALVGVAFASREHQAERNRRIAAGVGLALLAAVGFGFYFPPMHAAGKVDFWWATLVFRVTTLALVVSAVAAARPPLALRRRDLLICIGVGIGDTLGNTLYAAASRSGLESLTSVLASLYPIVTVALAAVVLKEQMAPAQRVGIGLTLTGVILISI